MPSDYIRAGLYLGSTESLVTFSRLALSAPQPLSSQNETYECGEPAVGESWVQFITASYNS
jgi:NADH:ubiquinone oxidoreductase subunit 3 (subunit A)